MVTDCVRVNGTSQCRGLSSTQWKRCSENASEASVPLAQALSSTAKDPPSEGQLCRASPGPQVNCTKGDLCLPLPEVALLTVPTVRSNILPSRYSCTGSAVHGTTLWYTMVICWCGTALVIALQLFHTKTALCFAIVAVTPCNSL